MKFTPIYDNYTENRYIVISTGCHQVYGYFSGKCKIDDKIIEFDNILGFIEQAKNRW